MWILYLVIAGTVFLLIKAIYDRIIDKKKLKENLLNNFGKPCDFKTSSEELDRVAYFSEHTSGSLMDDITANDINFYDLYNRINHTSSAPGEEYLYALLRRPVFDIEELNKREKLFEFFKEKSDIRTELQYQLLKVRKNKYVSMYASLAKIDQMEKDSTIFHVFCGLGVLVSAVISPIYIKYGVPALIFFLFLNVITYYSRKHKVREYMTAFSQANRMCDCLESIAAMNLPELSEENADIKKALKATNTFRKCMKYVSISFSGDMLGMIMDYVNMILHIDLILFNFSLNNAKKCLDDIFLLYETAGYIDSMISITAYRENLTFYCLPELVQSEKPFVKATQIYHPLLDNPVSLDIDVHKGMLITGSNASGKSTFLKEVAINLFFAQTIHTCTAKSFNASYCRVLTSMAVKDNIITGDSYYIAEIKSVKRILDEKADVPVIGFTDELFKGTNTVERIAANIAVLTAFADSNKLIFAASHDIELCERCSDRYDNYHFTEDLAGDDIVFTYKLLPGPSDSGNAIRLLKKYGFSEEITKNAEKNIH